MRIQAIPIEDKTSASRRIRYKAFLRALPAGFEHSKWKGSLDCDVLYIQKLIRDWTISTARIAQRRGIPVVFDLDDIREYWHDKPYDKMFRYVNAITTDTENKAQEIRKHTEVPVYVIPDTIDYSAVEAPKIRIRDKIERVTTFGRHQNVKAVKPYFKVMKAYQNTYICDRHVPELRDYGLVRWNADKMLYSLGQYDLAILAHHKHFAVDMKSNNRLLVCMAIGLPAIVSPCQAYSETVTEAGFPCLIAKPKELEDRLEQISTYAARQAISVACRAYVRKKYPPSKSGKLLAEVFEAVCQR